MPVATTSNSKGTGKGGALVPIPLCHLTIPDPGDPTGESPIRIDFDNLPDISDSKSVTYNDETPIGRASPMKTYAHSDQRTISLQIHLFTTKSEDIMGNLEILRAIQSAAYPREGATGVPFTPPVICRLACGSLLAVGDLCVVLRSYSVKFPTEVAWHNDLFSRYVPVKFDIDTTWEVVYRSSDLPGQKKILEAGK